MKLGRILRFEVQKKSGQRADHAGSVSPPSIYPSFVLNYNYDWNDYGYSNWYALFFFPEPATQLFLGEIKLMTTQEYDAFHYIRDGFEALSDEYCSIGLENDYYRRLYKYFGTEGAKDILSALRDCAVNIEIRNAFVNTEEYKVSLMRDLSSNKVVKEARAIITGKSFVDLFSFNYHFSPEYDKRICLDWSVEFKYDAQPWDRYVGVIGENGMGKTQLLKHLIRDMYENKDNFAMIPAFSSVIVIHSTPYDEYDEIKSNDTTMPYYAFSIEQDRNNVFDLLSNALTEIVRRGLIDKKSLANVFKKQLYKIIMHEWVDSLLFQVSSDDETYMIWQYDPNVLKTLIPKTSSGQLHLFMLLAQVFAHANLNTLFVIDEPEVHLHPKAIMDFLDILGSILSTFDSYAIIATHSPLIIREMRGHNVYLMQHINNGILDMANLPYETFGENIAVLYHKIFGYDEKTSLFTKTVTKLVEEGNSYERICEILSNNEDLNFNASMIISNEIMKSKRNA